MNEDAISEQTSRIIFTKLVFLHDKIKEVKTMKAMELQADPKNRQSYKDCLSISILI